MGDIREIRDKPYGQNRIEYTLFLAMRGLGLDPKPQYHISNLIADFAFPDEMLVVEINGPDHDTEDGIARDKKRWYVLNERGWKVKKFRADKVRAYTAFCAEKVKEELGKINGYDKYDSTPSEPVRRLFPDELSEQEEEVDAMIREIKKERQERKKPQEKDKGKEAIRIMRAMGEHVRKEKEQKLKEIKNKTKFINMAIILGIVFLVLFLALKSSNLAQNASQNTISDLEKKDAEMIAKAQLVYKLCMDACKTGNEDVDPVEAYDANEDSVTGTIYLTCRCKSGAEMTWDSATNAWMKS